MFFKKITLALILLFVTLPQPTQLSAQDMKPDYSAHWKRIEEFESKGLPKSAYDAAEAVFELAVSDNDHVQQLKALTYLARITPQIQEGGWNESLSIVESRLESFTPAVKSVAHLMLAQAYRHYMVQNSWRMSGRTTVDVQGDDIRTWDVVKFTETILDHLEGALLPAAELRSIEVGTVSDLLKEELATRHLRPTLFDFVSHTALAQLAGGLSMMPQPTEPFLVDAGRLMIPAEEFVNLEIESGDSLSLPFRGLGILQQLIGYRLNEYRGGGSEAALVDADLRRLQYVLNESFSVDKNEQFISAASALAERHAKNDIAGEVLYQAAQVLVQQGGQFSGNNTFRLKIREAVELCQDVIATYPDTDGAVNCEALIHGVSEAKIDFAVEQVVAPVDPFLIRLEYRNLEAVYVKAVSLSPSELSRFTNASTHDERMQQVERWAQQAGVWNRRVELPEHGDYQSHSAEFSADGIKLGPAMILISTDKEFDPKQLYAYAFTQASNLGIAHRTNRSGVNEVLVVDRMTGRAPEAGCELIVRFPRNEPSSSARTFSCDSDGRTLLPVPERTSYALEISSGDDYLVDTRRYYASSSNYVERANNRTMLFTDRSIYRPGQTVYFKGLMVHGIPGEYAIRVGEKSTLTLLDANRQEVSSVDLVSNEFGSFTGSFALPVSGLTGNFSIRSDAGEVNFRVEEYKRPTFNVEVLAPEGAPVLDGDVRVTGKAEGFAGNVLSNAAVSYRVVRTVRFYPWFYFRRGWIPPRWQQAEIANGLTETSADGTFEIMFEAVPDPQVNPHTKPIFDYQITAEVTDISGETRVASRTVSIGYEPFVISANIKSDVDRQSLGEIVIETKNLNSVPVITRGDYSLTKLKEPSRAYRDRLWSKVDSSLVKKSEFRNRHPLDAFGSELDMETWKEEKLIKTGLFSTDAESKLNIEGSDDWPIGAYKLEIHAEDSTGKDASSTYFFTLFDSANLKIPYPQIFMYNAVALSGEPGEKAVIHVGSSEDIRIMVEVERRGQIDSRTFYELENELTTIELPILEEDRGNFAVHIVAAVNGRIYSRSETIRVPYTNKRLQAKFQTFRSKLYPGQEEQWQIKIENSDDEPELAELLATLYDASLDEFADHRWNLNLLRYNSATRVWQSSSWGAERGRVVRNTPYGYLPVKARTYDALAYSLVYGGGLRPVRGGRVAMSATPRAEAPEEGFRVDAAIDDAVSPELEAQKSGAINESASSEPVQVRKNLNELAFFIPQARTDVNGNLTLSFTMPEALTAWRFMGLAHTKDLKTGTLEERTVTQKELMVIPNMPRFFREGDRIVLAAKISNLSDSSLTGTASLEMLDAESLEPIPVSPLKTSFSTFAGGNDLVDWEFTVPDGLSAVIYRVIAEGGSHSDGEEAPIPVLTNRMLVTESLPLPMRDAGTKEFTFEKLANVSSNTLRHHGLTLEYSPNPIWYAVQALPYLMEYPYECSEQIFSRYYANSIAAHIVDSNPRIKAIYNEWSRVNSDALVSNLEKNQELKNIILEETPWVRAAQDETERKRRMGLLFDSMRMKGELEIALQKLARHQNGDGGFPWFDGGRSSRYITQHIVKGFGNLMRLDVVPESQATAINSMVVRAINYMDRAIVEDFQRHRGDEDEYLSNIQVHYLYARSFFPNTPVAGQVQEAHDYFYNQLESRWLEFPLQSQAMIATTLYRSGDQDEARGLVDSFNERAILSDELGMYWKLAGGYYWFQAPIETQAMLIETYVEVGSSVQFIPDMQLWLLKQKQVQDWNTTKATSDAIYALMLRGSDLISQDSRVLIQVGPHDVDSGELEQSEAGTGYFKKNWSSELVSPQMAQVVVTKEGEGPGWGSLYWQYFEDLDKITPAETPLKLTKKLYVKSNTDAGPLLEAYNEGDSLNVGDLVTVRIELEVDRRMEFVHLKDMRSSGLEPTEVLSGYRWNQGLGYYQSTRDAATNFFFATLPEGRWVFEYPLRVFQAGTFSNGISSIQSMYAPEFASHSAGLTVIARGQQ